MRYLSVKVRRILPPKTLYGLGRRGGIAAAFFLLLRGVKRSSVAFALRRLELATQKYGMPAHAAEGNLK